MVDWMIIYGDGSIYTNLDGPPEMAPESGVQFIAQRDDPERIDNCGYSIVTLGDYYIYTGIEWSWWLAVDKIGFHDYLLNRRLLHAKGAIDHPRPLFIFGRYIPTNLYKELHKKIKQYEGTLLPKKSAFKKHEPM